MIAIDIKTHDSESQDQEEAGHTRRTSKLISYRYHRSGLVNAVNKPPLKLLLSYHPPSTHSIVY